MTLRTRPASMSRSFSSGDLLADRRYAYAEALLGEDDAEGAADLARQVLELTPSFVPGWFLLGAALERRFLDRGRADDRAEAIAAFGRALACDPEDRLGAGLRLARLGIGDPQAAMTPAYVRALFEGYAPRFERHLVDGLNYRAPEQIRAVLDAFPDRPRRFTTAIDLGCGTGLVGRALRDQVDRLVGIDLSPAMLAIAARGGHYDRLLEGDAGAVLAEEPEASSDLVVAGDLLIYVGRLDPLFGAVSRVLGGGGFFALSVQAHDGEGVVLGPDGRYAQSDGALTAAAARHGLVLASLVRAEIRTERGGGVPGRIALLRRAPADQASQRGPR